jgi:chemotaxis protein CheZ
MVAENLRGKVDSLYQEVWGLARDIVKARTLIADLQPGILQRESLPRAVEEMHEIVRTTEDASNAIMESAETIVEAIPDNIEAEYRDLIQSSCQRIFESCAFQDLTGQRIKKVMTTLQSIDEHMEALQELLGTEFEVPEDGAPSKEDDGLLAGPALEGEGNDQDDIDKLFETL